jgi:serine/threonine-protein kinase
VPSDVVEFAQALARGDQETAVEIYAGPFLDGFFLPGASEFGRWVEEERDRLARRWREAVEALARRKSADGAPDAAALWRRLAAADPPNGRVAVELMRALDRAGDRAGALAHARVHGALLREEFHLPPDPDSRRSPGRSRAGRRRPSAAPRARDAGRLAGHAVHAGRGRRARAIARGRDVAGHAVRGGHAALAAHGGAARSGRRRRRVARRVGLVALTSSAVVAILANGRVRVAPRQGAVDRARVAAPRAPTLDPRRVVVAPLENGTGDSSLTAFGEMVADWTTQALATPRSSTS